MFRSLFIEDVVRFYKQGLLPFVCVALLTRAEIWITYAGIGALFLLFAHGPQDDALIVFLAVFVTCFFVGHYTVHILTPLWFGSYFCGRLTDKYVRFLVKTWRYGAWFRLVPSAAELNVETIDMPPGGTIGRTYLLLRHPADHSIILPLIDDNPTFMRHMMGFVGNERQAELAAEIAKLRPAAG
ncbi:MAG TPA: hypothetical protein VMF12_16030 [Xanthobacteraceae bacterium]|nr:hypothetical protein [Xanthobacteraceae bacterium]